MAQVAHATSAVSLPLPVITNVPGLMPLPMFFACHRYYTRPASAQRRKRTWMISRICGRCATLPLSEPPDLNLSTTAAAGRHAGAFFPLIYATFQSTNGYTQTASQASIQHLASLLQVQPPTRQSRTTSGSSSRRMSRRASRSPRTAATPRSRRHSTSQEPAFGRAETHPHGEGKGEGGKTGHSL